MLRRTLLALPLLTLYAPLLSAEEAAPTTVRLLTVGNSFSANATKHLPGLAKAAGKTLIHTPLVIGGASMQVHLDKAKLHEANPADPKGCYTSKRGLKESLAAEPWDVITIQMASIKSHDIANYRPSATELRDYIKKYAPKSEIVVHQTWAYRVDDPRFTKPAEKPGEPATQEAMYEGLTSAYNTIAKELGGLRIIPTGDAFHIADNDPQWRFQPDTTFNPKTAKQGELPNQKHSLHMGWQWKKGKDGKTTLGMDGHHANIAGEYLGGCCFFEVLFKQSCVGNTYVPKGLSAEDARYLQEVAHKAVAARGIETTAVKAAAAK
ncbi:DUF4886 domain-containing protein [Verrucomicrobium sp. BvORR106]|uniref:DUF4886 domain-containing protein n=1 Tax=Verrucomicrobium sp. BvORR106 TaxID=1403819 RepID=UPI0009E02543|nr:DUF4886 domain-containing protein [Verrucomicrobium sp. BvORR106]